MIPFVCSGCGAQLQIGEQWAGGLGHCPHCGSNSRVPGNPKRTSKLVILARIVAIPVAGVAFYAPFMGWSFFLGGVLAVGLGLLFLWAFTNLWTFLSGPREYRLWKAGGGDPWFDTLDPPLNMDPPSVRYRELYFEKLRLESEAITPPAPPAPSPSTDDLNLFLG